MHNFESSFDFTGLGKNIIVSNRLPIQVTKLDNSFEFTPLVVA